MARTPQKIQCVQYVLLGLLFQQPGHGNELHKRISSKSGIGLLWSVKQGNLYAMLDRMERRGLVRSSVRPGESNPSRKEFFLTLTGRVAFEAWISTPVRAWNELPQDFLSKYYFARQCGPAVLSSLIQQQLEVTRGWLKQVEDELAGMDASQAFEKDVLCLRREQIGASLRWLESLVSQARLAGAEKVIPVSLLVPSEPNQ